MRDSLLRRRRKDYIFDKLHRTTVTICIGLTVVGTALLGAGVIQYMFFERPKRKEELRLREQQLLTEGDIKNATV